MFGYGKKNCIVLVVDDCREGGTASGKLGILEGDYPRSVIFILNGEMRVGEHPYDAYINGLLQVSLFDDDKKIKSYPAKDAAPIWDGEGERPKNCVVVKHNPRILLKDGSYIWGDECWWTTYHKGMTLKQAKKDLEIHINAIKIYLAAYSNLDNNESSEILEEPKEN